MKKKTFPLKRFILKHERLIDPIGSGGEDFFLLKILFFLLEREGEREQAREWGEGGGQKKGKQAPS